MNRAGIEALLAAPSRTAPLGIKPGRYQPGDGLLAFLEAL